METVHLGFNNVVMKQRVVGVISAAAKPVKRLVEQARKDSRAVDVTSGRKTRSVVITDSGFIFLSSLQPQTIIERIESNAEVK